MADRAYGNSLMDWLSQQTGMDYSPMRSLPYSVSPRPESPNPMKSEAPAPSPGAPDFLQRIWTNLANAPSRGEIWDSLWGSSSPASLDRAPPGPSPDQSASPDRAPPAEGVPPPSSLPTAAPWLDQGGQSSGLPSLEDTIAAFQKMLPDRKSDDGRQAQADAELAKMQDRNRLLAQLAFAGGVVSGAGKQWEGIGKGFLSAAATYDEGFQRYQQALQDGADRATRKEDRDYELGISRNKAAFDYYNAARQDARANAKEGREVLKERMDLIDKYFTSIIDAHKDDIDGQAADVWGDAWRKSRAAGEIILPSENVADEETN